MSGRRPGRDVGTGGRGQPRGRDDGAPTKWHAPYNFVRLPKDVIRVDEPPDADRYHSDRLTGSITIAVTTETPLFIPGSGSGDFFKTPDDVLRVAGSSLRGSVRSLFEIMTWSGTDSIDNALLFYRKLPEGRDALGVDYLEQLDGDRVQGGWIRKGRSSYYLHKVKPVNRNTWFQVRKNVVETEFEELRARVVMKDGERKTENSDWQRLDVWFAPPASGREVTAIHRSNPGTVSTVEGVLIRPGPKRGLYDWIIPRETEDERGVELSSDVVEEYQMASGGVTQLVDKNHFSVLPTDEKDRPAFFIKGRDDDPDVILFGHTRYFRLPYKNRVHKRIIPADFVAGGLDLARAVFGFTVEGEYGGRRGRVSFCDLTCTNKGEEVVAGPPRALFSPRPTSYQLYLESTKNDSKVVHWDMPEAQIRGTKMYWHRPGAEWADRRPDNKKEKSQRRATISPLGKGTIFTGTIRFENLAEHELGALLFALDLPEECRHRLGYGKPLGMGSVHIKVDELKLSKRALRYERIFDKSGMAYHQPEDEGNVGDLKETFAGWMIKELTDIEDSSPDAQSQLMQDRLWAHFRMRELREMLKFKGAPDCKETAYLDGPKKFRRDTPLPWLLGSNSERAAHGGRASQTPAHNVGGGDAPTLATVWGQSQKPDREKPRVKPGDVVPAVVTEARGITLKVRVEGLEFAITVDVGALKAMYKPEDLAPGGKVRVKIIEKSGKLTGQLLAPANR